MAARKKDKIVQNSIGASQHAGLHDGIERYPQAPRLYSPNGS